MSEDRVTRISVRLLDREYQVACPADERSALLDGEEILGLEPDVVARAGLFLAFQYPSEIPGVTIANFIRAAIVARPAEGWTDLSAFWNQPALNSLEVEPAARDQVTVRTDYYDVRIDVDHGGVHAVRTALIESRPGGKARTVIRRWTSED